MTVTMLLFTVEERFLITGIGLVLTPGLGDKKASINDKIRLVRPNKTIVDTKIPGITFESKDIQIEGNLTKEDVPIGTEVWLIE